MIRSISAGFLLLILSGAAALAGSGDMWLHITVDEKGENGDRVRINLPMKLLESVLPLIDADGLHKGRIRINHCDLDDIDLRALLAAVREAEDGEYVTVESPSENVRAMKKRNELIVRVREDGEEPEIVHVRIRMEVIDALLSGEPDELDVLAAIRLLAEKGESELVSVEDGEDRVRIWIDSKNTSE